METHQRTLKVSLLKTEQGRDQKPYALLRIEAPQSDQGEQPRDLWVRTDDTVYVTYALRVLGGEDAEQFKRIALDHARVRAAEKEAVRKFLSASGNDLCWENRRELAEAFGLGEVLATPPAVLSDPDEFYANCQHYCRRLYPSWTPPTAEDVPKDVHDLKVANERLGQQLEDARSERDEARKEAASRAADFKAACKELDALRPRVQGLVDALAEKTVSNVRLRKQLRQAQAPRPANEYEPDPPGHVPPPRMNVRVTAVDPGAFEASANKIRDMVQRQVGRVRAEGEEVPKPDEANYPGHLVQEEVTHRVCRCGHEAILHTGGTGECQYSDGSDASCTCNQFKEAERITHFPRRKPDLSRHTAPLPEGYKQIVISRSHHNDFLRHGPGKGNWWATQYRPDLSPGDKVRFVLENAPTEPYYVDAEVHNVALGKDYQTPLLPQDFSGWWVTSYAPEPRPDVT